MKKNSIKNTRVNAEVQRELSNIIRSGIKDPRVARDDFRGSCGSCSGLKDMLKHISVSSGIRKPRRTRSAACRVRRDISAESWRDTINMRNTPEIRFIVDQSIEYGVNISRKIDEVTRDLDNGVD